jgi:hypothetical protein
MTSTIDAAGLLIRSYPPSAAEWEAIKTREDFDAGLPYTHLGGLAKFLVDRIKSGETKDMTGLFVELEELIHGREARNLFIVGFLEDLQNLSLNRGVLLDRWSSRLRPNTKVA